jgi:hypothetical protein
MHIMEHSKSQSDAELQLAAKKAAKKKEKILEAQIINLLACKWSVEDILSFDAEREKLLARNFLKPIYQELELKLITRHANKVEVRLEKEEEEKAMQMQMENYDERENDSRRDRESETTSDGESRSAEGGVTQTSIDTIDDGKDTITGDPSINTSTNNREDTITRNPSSWEDTSTNGLSRRTVSIGPPQTPPDIPRSCQEEQNEVPVAHVRAKQQSAGEQDTGHIWNREIIYAHSTARIGVGRLNPCKVGQPFASLPTTLLKHTHSNSQTDQLPITNHSPSSLSLCYLSNTNSSGHEGVFAGCHTILIAMQATVILALRGVAILFLSTTIFAHDSSTSSPPCLGLARRI